MLCTSPIFVKVGSVEKSVPCGQCMSCRINRSTEWRIRLMYELSWFDGDAVFITLTYDEEHLPKDYSLHKEDLQKFFKRLRRDIPDHKIKYFAVGEYGGDYGRPHYHAIVFGLAPTHFYRKLVIENWPFCDPLRFNGLKKGFCPANPRTIGYVTSYFCKKNVPPDWDKLYPDLQKPFTCCSQKLGLLYAEAEELERFRKNGYLTFGGKPAPIPRYFVRKFNLDVSQGVHKALMDKVDRIGGLDVFKDLHLRSDLLDYEYFMATQENREQLEKDLKAHDFYRSMKK